ncbi:hypothetical protein CVT26_008107 [Gymnopilus dilepis]|uniref:Uncharacterized protein n=1 Tax=Gymnopilus dilepis TaxID=231916 RepID=A0A409WWH6_9AGAR|nr:hypothetical protein CVT26_008107 [Gymnopilus dilepis]
MCCYRLQASPSLPVPTADIPFKTRRVQILKPKVCLQEFEKYSLWILGHCRAWSGRSTPQSLAMPRTRMSSIVDNAVDFQRYSTELVIYAPSVSNFVTIACNGCGIEDCSGPASVRSRMIFRSPPASPSTRQPLQLMSFARDTLQVAASIVPPIHLVL